LAVALATAMASVITAGLPLSAQAATYDSGYIPFELDEVQGGFDGATFATTPDILCDVGVTGSPACPEDGPQPIANDLGTLYPTDTDFGFYVVDFYGAAGKERDGLYGEGWIGPITDAESDPGLMVSNARTDRFKTVRGDGTWCAGMGGTSVKCSTENFTVMENVLTCYETVPYFYADAETGAQGDLVDPETGDVIGNCVDYDLTPLSLLEPPAGFDILTMPPNESDLYNIARDPSGEYSVTRKDDGKFLMRWGNFIKRPNDVRVHKVIPLPEEWKDPGANYRVTKALLYIDHWITNNPNDQVRPEDMENEDARGRKPGYVVQADGSWVSNRDCYQGDGTFIEAGTYLKNLTSYTPPPGCPALEELGPGDDPDCAVGDLKEGLTNAWSTTIDREPFEWSYRCEFPNAEDTSLTEVDFIGSPTPLEDDDLLGACPDGSDATLESGPRWRLKPNKFGQDIPGLEIPKLECSPLPFQSNNIKYRTGNRVTTVLDLLDWSPREDGPLTHSNEWVYAGQNFQNLDADDNIGCGSNTLSDTNCLSINGTEMTEDFDLIWYVKGDRKPTVVYSARLVLEYDAPVTPTELAATNDIASTPSNVSATIDVLANDGGTAPRVDSVTQPANGQVVNNTTDVTYTHNSHELESAGESAYSSLCSSCHSVIGLSGTENFTYTVSDVGPSQSASVQVSVGSLDSAIGGTCTNSGNCDLSEYDSSSAAFQDCDGLNANSPHNDCKSASDAQVQAIGRFLGYTF
jgi:hypothetical protein